MATIVGALRNLYRKLGGTDSGTKTIAGMIDKVADVAGGGGGGGSVMAVNVVQQTGQYDFQVDKSFNEVATHLAADPKNTVFISNTNWFGTCPLTRIYGTREAPERLLFGNVYKDGVQVYVNAITWFSYDGDTIHFDFEHVGSANAMIVYTNLNTQTGILTVKDVTAGTMFDAIQYGTDVVIQVSVDSTTTYVKVVQADRRLNASGSLPGYSFIIPILKKFVELTATGINSYPSGSIA